MEKIRLNNGQEFELVPMGTTIFGGSMTFEIVSNLEHAEILQHFKDIKNIESIEYILSDDTTYTTYMDCVGFMNTTYIPRVNEEDNTFQNVYIVELKVDKVERLLRNMQTKTDAIEKENAVLKVENESLKEEILLSDIDTDYRLSILELGL